MMYHTWEPKPLGQLAPRWAARIPRYPLVFGSSYLGHLFVCGSDHILTGIVVTDRPEFIPLKTETLPRFHAEFLASERIQNDLFRAGDCALLCERLGTPSADECFYPVPYPAIGGSGALDTYSRGDLWVHLEIYGQALKL